jgi:hypothetical protein
MNRSFIFLLFSLMIFFSCKNDKTGAVSDDVGSGMPVEEIYYLSNQTGRSDSLINVYRTSATTILEHRLAESKANVVTDLNKDLWHLDAVLRGSDVTFGDNINGAWVDFNDDNTYTYGNYGDKRGNGRYAYDSEKALLLLLDNDKRIKPQEFQTQIQNDALVLVGQSIYADNNMQAKLARKTALPVKQPKQPVQ